MIPGTLEVVTWAGSGHLAANDLVFLEEDDGDLFAVTPYATKSADWAKALEPANTQDLVRVVVLDQDEIPQVTDDD